MASSSSPAAPRKRRLVNAELLTLDPRLRESVLAAPWQRAAAMAIDLVLIGMLSLLAGPVLGLLTGLTLAALGSRKVSDTKFWQAFRWVLIGLGAAVMLLSGLLQIGHPLVRTGAFNLTRSRDRPATDTVYVSPTASSADLRRAIDELNKQIGDLKADNERLRGAGADNPVLSTVTALSKSLGLTFGWAGVYFTLFTSWFGGRTPGKLVFGTRVMRLDGRALTAMDAFTRNGGYAAGLATGMIGFLRLLWDPNRQAIQDKIAGTVVVSTRQGVSAASDEPKVRIPAPEGESVSSPDPDPPSARG